MPWKKSSRELVARFQSALPVDALIQPRQMFGYPASFVNGNFFAGLHQESLVIRLPDEQKAKLPALRAARAFEPMAGRPMKGWWVVPKDWVVDGSKTAELLRAALVLAKELPAKNPAVKGKAKTRKK